MTTCPACGASVAANTRFCQNCGARIDSAPPAAPAPTRKLDDPSAPPASPAHTVILDLPDEPTAAPPASPAQTVRLDLPDEPAAPPASPAATVQLDAVPAPAEQAASPAAPGAFSLPPAAPAPATPPAATRRTWLWILLGVGVLLVLLVVACAVALFVFGSFGATGGAPLGTPVGVGVAVPIATRPATSPAATAQATPLRDDFSDEQASLLLAGGDTEARYSFIDGAYQVDVRMPNQLAWSELDGSYADASLAAAATIREGPPESAAALLFRYQDGDNFYIFNVAANGTYSLELRRNSQWTRLIDWTASPAIRSLNEANLLRVDATGDTFTLYVNDTRLGVATDPTFQRGGLALAVNTFDDGGARVTFDDLSVQSY